jgi:hypothetical protein
MQHIQSKPLKSASRVSARAFAASVLVSGILGGCDSKMDNVHKGMDRNLDNAPVEIHEVTDDLCKSHGESYLFSKYTNYSGTAYGHSSDSGLISLEVRAGDMIFKEDWYGTVKQPNLNTGHFYIKVNGVDSKGVVLETEYLLKDCSYTHDEYRINYASDQPPLPQGGLIASVNPTSSSDAARLTFSSSLLMK